MRNVKHAARRNWQTVGGKRQGTLSPTFYAGSQEWCVQSGWLHRSTADHSLPVPDRRDTARPPAVPWSAYAVTTPMPWRYRLARLMPVAFAAALALMPPDTSVFAASTLLASI
jgi:hypothetical protein